MLLSKIPLVNVTHVTLQNGNTKEAFKTTYGACFFLTGCGMGGGEGRGFPYERHKDACNLLKGSYYGFRSHLGSSGQNTNVVSPKRVWFRVLHEEIKACHTVLTITMRLKRQGLSVYNNNTIECCNDGIYNGAKKFYKKPKTALLINVLKIQIFLGEHAL